MEFEFECECGAHVSEFTRGDGPEFKGRFRCEGCGTVYAITVTALAADND